MKPKFTYFYSNSCNVCEELKPLIQEFKQPLQIEMIDADGDNLLLEDYQVDWIPTLVLEDKDGKHSFTGLKEIKQVLHEIISSS